jgi:CelD/BcsL family acetyltransferase involved in cellulose biosynthesis
VPAGWQDQIGESDPCPVLTLPDTAEALALHVSRSLLHNLAYYRRRAARSGSVRAELADARSLDEIHAALVRLHGARWSRRGMPGVLADDMVRRWHADAMHGLLDLGVLRLHALRLDGRIIAACYVLQDRKRPGARAYYYLGGFDPAYERLSPGTIVIAHAVEEAIREGAATFDFLRGREPYKYLWGAADRPTYRRGLTRAAAAPASPASSAALVPVTQ